MLRLRTALWQRQPPTCIDAQTVAGTLNTVVVDYLLPGALPRKGVVHDYAHYHDFVLMLGRACRQWRIGARRAHLDSPPPTPTTHSRRRYRIEPGLSSL